MRKTGMLFLFFITGTTALYASAVPEKVWQALDNYNETYNFKGTRYNSLEVITDAVNKGMDLTREYPTRYRYSNTPLRWYVRMSTSYTLDGLKDDYSNLNNPEIKKEYTAFVERFLKLVEMIPEEKRGYVFSSKLRRSLNGTSGPDYDYLLLLVDPRAGIEIAYSEMAALESLRSNREINRLVSSFWQISEDDMKAEPLKTRQLAYTLGIGPEPSFPELLEELGLTDFYVLRKASDIVDMWVSRPLKENEDLERFIAQWLENGRYSDIPYIEKDSAVFTSTFLGHAFRNSRPEHFEYLVSLGLRPDGDTLTNDFDFYRNSSAHFAGWFSNLATKGSDWLAQDHSDREKKMTREVLKIYINKGFDLNDGYNPSFNGNALSTASWIGDLETVKLLVNEGLDIRAKTSDMLPVDIARRQGFADIVEYLDPLTYGGGGERVVIREQEAVDENPPRIRLNPLGGERGLKISEEQKYDATTTLSSILIGGIVVDEGDIEKVLLAGRETVFNNLGEFEARVDLKLGENRILISAEDEAGNRAKEELLIFREEARTLADELGLTGTSYALVIGNEEYADMPKLQTPHEDAERISSILADRYGFSTEVLLDAERSAILDAVNRYVSLLSEEDRFILYYAGHGYFDETADLAYWLPVDASTGSDTNWILSNRITGSLRRMKARHVAVISDSCYSGTLTRDADIDLTQEDRAAAEYLKRMVSRPSRTILSSGGNEPVADGGGGGHSVFARYLIDALEGSEKEVFSLEDLFHSRIRVQVTGNSLQTPEYNTIRNSGHEGGDFVFIRQ